MAKISLITQRAILSFLIISIVVFFLDIFYAWHFDSQFIRYRVQNFGSGLGVRASRMALPYAGSARCCLVQKMHLGGGTA